MTQRSKRNELILAADVGGTKTAVSIVDAEGITLAESQAPTDGSGTATEFAMKLVDTFEQFLAIAGFSPSEIALASLSLAAKCVTTNEGIRFLGDNIPAIHVTGGVPLTEIVAKRLARPVFGLNDGVAAALGEQGVPGGAAHGAPNIAAITIGTGTGGAIVADRRPVFFDLATVDGEPPAENSANRNGPEIGHWRVDWSEDAPRCGCSTDLSINDRGHLEALFSGKALESTALGPRANLSLLHDRGLVYLPQVLLPLVERYEITKIVIAGGIGAALMDAGFGSELEQALRQLSRRSELQVVKANFANASLKGAERFGLMNLPGLHDAQPETL